MYTHGCICIYTRQVLTCPITPCICICTYVCCAENGLCETSMYDYWHNAPSNNNLLPARRATTTPPTTPQRPLCNRHKQHLIFWKTQRANRSNILQGIIAQNPMQENKKAIQRQHVRDPACEQTVFVWIFRVPPDRPDLGGQGLDVVGPLSLTLCLSWLRLHHKCLRPDEATTNLDPAWTPTAVHRPYWTTGLRVRVWGSNSQGNGVQGSMAVFENYRGRQYEFHGPTTRNARNGYESH